MCCESVHCSAGPSNVLRLFLKPGRRIGNEEFFEVPGKDVGAHDGATPAGEAGSRVFFENRRGSFFEPPWEQKKCKKSLGKMLERLEVEQGIF